MTVVNWRIIVTVLVVLALMYLVGAVILGSLGMDIHRRGIR